MIAAFFFKLFVAIFCVGQAWPARAQDGTHFDDKTYQFMFRVPTITESYGGRHSLSVGFDFGLYIQSEMMLKFSGMIGEGDAGNRDPELYGSYLYSSFSLDHRLFGGFGYSIGAGVRNANYETFYYNEGSGQNMSVTATNAGFTGAVVLLRQKPRYRWGFYLFEIFQPVGKTSTRTFTQEYTKSRTDELKEYGREEGKHRDITYPRFIVGWAW